MEEEVYTGARGVVVEFDFTAVDGAQILYTVARDVLARSGIDLSIKLEAKHLAGGNYQGGLRELFAAQDISADAAAVAHDLSDAFKTALAEAAPKAVTPAFKAFLKAIADRGTKVVVATRADLDSLRPALADLDPKLVVPYAEVSSTYGNCKWDAWRRACTQNDLTNNLSVAITGSGKGVKSALVAGLSAVAVAHDHVAYQDFGGADALVDGFDAKLTATVLRLLHA